MPQKRDFSFHKSERLCSKRMIDALFAGGNKSMSVYPLRVVSMPVSVTPPAPTVAILISVSKRKFKRAVDSNRVKRQIREAYRKNKYILTNALQAQGAERGMAMAFLWMSNRIHTSAEVNRSVRLLLERVSEHLPAKEQHTSDDGKAI